ncbi:MAG: PstS family phosphate ABC transporter substrate-binding protein [Cyanobacteria bacterium SID2]|nr:PstS family phosphate ABC transporter substrate-binding protein [Cyanobacteria bacterium SID2]MBP0006313.1 PstS family phosphate ABC transporter substrate-binding protein [Cyanobacteria bacterium SBC]
MNVNYCLPKLLATWSIGLSLLVLGTGCQQTLEPPSDSSAQAQTPMSSTITVDGSSTVYPITNEIAQEYQLLDTQKPQIDVSVSGTGGGFRKFCAGETDISNASRPISKSEMETCKQAGIRYIELPIAYDALTVVVNPDNDWASDITLAELKKMWEPDAEGQVTTWSQVREGWPDEPMILYGPGEDSGTFDYFTEAIVGESGDSRKDYTASEDDTLTVRGVSRDLNGLGYFGYAYYEENLTQLKAIEIEGVAPSRENVVNSEYQPFSRPLFIYVNADALDAKPELESFVDYYLTHGRQFVKVAGYVALSDEIYNLAYEHFVDRRVGTVFEGEAQFGLTIEELLQKEAEF